MVKDLDLITDKLIVIEFAGPNEIPIVRCENKMVSPIEVVWKSQVCKNSLGTLAKEGKL